MLSDEEKKAIEIEDNKKYIDLHYVHYEQYISKLNELNKKWEDKIKAKIEELNNPESEFFKSLFNTNEPTWTLTIQRVLRSLLEKELKYE